MAGGYAPGVAGYGADRERRFRHQATRQYNIADIMIGLGETAKALGERRRRAETQANDAYLAEQVMQETNPTYGPKEQTRYAGAADALTNLGRTFNPMYKPQGALTGQGAVQLAGLQTQREQTREITAHNREMEAIGAANARHGGATAARQTERDRVEDLKFGVTQGRMAENSANQFDARANSMSLLLANDQATKAAAMSALAQDEDPETQNFIRAYAQAPEEQRVALVNQAITAQRGLANRARQGATEYSGATRAFQGHLNSLIGGADQSTGEMDEKAFYAEKIGARDPATLSDQEWADLEAEWDRISAGSR